MFIVNNCIWKITFVPMGNRKLIRSDGSFTVGVTDNSDKTIYLSANLQGAFLKKVLSHEVTHVFCFEYGVALDIETEEILADFISLYGSDIVYLVEELLRKLVMAA